MYSFKENLRELRKEAHMTQKEVAQKVNMGETAYQAYEQGRNQPPLEVLIRLANLFECSVDYLVGRETEYDVVRIETDLTEKQRELLNNYERLNVEGKARLIGYLMALLEQPALLRR